MILWRQGDLRALWGNKMIQSHSGEWNVATVMSPNSWLSHVVLYDRPTSRPWHYDGVWDFHGKEDRTRIFMEKRTQPVVFKVEEAMNSGRIELICPLRTPSFPTGTHEYEPIGHSFIEWVRNCIITRESKINERVGAAMVINGHFQNGEMTCRQLSKRFPDNSIFATEATAITLALDYYQYMDPVQHDVVVYSGSMSCLHAIEGEDTENLIRRIMNLLLVLSDKALSFCWVPSHYGIECNEIVDQLTIKTLDHHIDPLTTFHCACLKPSVNSYSQQEVQINRDVSVHEISSLETNTRATQENIHDIHLKRWDGITHPCSHFNSGLFLPQKTIFSWVQKFIRILGNMQVSKNIYFRNYTH